ncbi:HdaA/DnaA family protein [Emcibacter nanhaiensis]|uniref:DNA replication protein n=1 Tax=Emcibacter nanhaiensis TaxID=1505037 RepID=A0A501PRD5_9PROT|nr:DNA replication protein [Emcibacter nanhaiensis]TPD63090.1 DNA replication protein [Emcibacter nanhaiensis]
MTPVQLPLNLPVRQAFGHEDFLVAASNTDAVNWIDRWPDWPSHVLILFGDEGCGKTHLSHVWQDRSSAIRLNEEEFFGQPLVGREKAYIFEDVDTYLSGPGREEQLLHSYNWLKEKASFLLLTARTHPRSWGMSLPDLSSRILSCPIVEMGQADDSLLASVIIKQFADLQVILPSEVLDYLLPRIDRSFAGVRRTVRRIDRLALTEKRAVTIPLARKALESLED